MALTTSSDNDFHLDTVTPSLPLLPPCVPIQGQTHLPTLHLSFSTTLFHQIYFPITSSKLHSIFGVPTSNIVHNFTCSGQHLISYQYRTCEPMHPCSSHPFQTIINFFLSIFYHIHFSNFIL